MMGVVQMVVVAKMFGMMLDDGELLYAWARPILLTVLYMRRVCCSSGDVAEVMLHL